MSEDPRASESERLHEVLVKDPTSRVFGQLAEAYRTQGLYAEAIAVCEQGLQHYPGFLGARMTFAHALAEYGDLPRAEAEFRRVLEVMPDSVPAHRALGELLRAQGKAAEALVVYQELRDLTPLDQKVQEVVQDLSAWAAPRGPTPAGLPTPGEPAEAAPVGEVTGREGPVPTYDLSEAAEAAASLPLGPAVGSPGEPSQTAGRPLATETLADLYVQQGFLAEAWGIYEEILRGDPARADIQAKLADLGTVGPAAPPPREADAVPAGISVPAAALAAPGADDVALALEAWLAAARSLRAEREPR